MKEIIVAKTTDLRDGQMQQIPVDDSQILLAKINGKFYATGAFCTHYGAPLAKGVLHEERVVCPWHHACFNLTNGNLKEPPALNDLPSFAVRIEGENVLVQIPKEIPDGCTPTMVDYDSEDKRVFVIIGAGAGGSIAAETLRQQGFQGKIVLISQEANLPYDRTKLSKNYLQGKASEDSLPLRSCEFYQEHDIELRFGQAVTKVDTFTKTITLADNSTLPYDALLLATGGKARKLNIPGSDLDHVFTLRQVEDAQDILKTVKQAKKAVVIGSSFIGMEAAASLRQQGIEVTVVSPSSVPFAKILGEEVGKMFQQLHQEKGVTFYLKTKVTELQGDGKVETVVLDNGEQIDTDLVIVGIGVEPITDYLTGVELAEDHSIPVSEYLQAAAPDLYAAGDIATFPYAPMGKPTRIEHWRLAAQHGRTAAYNMVNPRPIKFDAIPFFWSGQYDLKLRYVGHATEWDQIALDGDLKKQEFLAFYVKDDRILAVAGCGRDQDIAAIAKLMSLNQMPDADQIHSTDWVEKLKTINN
ncbi:Ferredoxin--NAD(+) reductase [Stanieria cyanosphaera PCC 7437]|uniref:Ferredoxin--NAD(+) reductase n=1 Tax=Stanieria cyanosphaera (strain ATCC 29371 / PCC 7437) TaxID=111780 RepID=K9XS25_STAC7|nr:FAD-dependent oxidoreductase [Stanieria cyanosphaera]AFZ34472.1 Ferredoxin--NAD(+) reductase [Stanieria cyanosphaera PCC 7437]